MHGMKEIEVLSDLKQIKAVSHVYRIQILEAFNEKPATAKQISDRLGEPHAKVNYHIKALAKVGILNLAEESIRMGIVEKFYVPVAKTFHIDSSAMKMTDEQVKASVDHASMAAFERTAKQFYDSLKKKDRIVANRISNHPDFYLTEEEAKELFTRIDEVLREYVEARKEPQEGKDLYFASLMLTRSGK